MQGPTAIVLTTTAIDIDEELLNRCLVLTVDEGLSQTRAIHDRQRSKHTLNGLLATDTRERLVALHQNAQRLLEPVAVVNPFADRLTFADGSTRTRRDHVKYLTLIRVIALLHQHQRTHRTATTADGRSVAYIEAAVADIELANRLAHDVLGQTLDELPPQTRRLLSVLDGVVSSEAKLRDVDRQAVRFTRRQLRERLGWGDTQLKVHLARLVDFELVIGHRADSGGNGLVYELAWSGEGVDGRRFLIGLTSPDQLTETGTTTENRSGSDEPWSGAGRPPVGGQSAPSLLTANGGRGGWGLRRFPSTSGARLRLPHSLLLPQTSGLSRSMMFLANFALEILVLIWRSTLRNKFRRFLTVYQRAENHSLPAIPVTWSNFLMELALVFEGKANPEGSRSMSLNQTALI